MSGSIAAALKQIRDKGFTLVLIGDDGIRIDYSVDNPPSEQFLCWVKENKAAIVYGLKAERPQRITRQEFAELQRRLMCFISRGKATYDELVASYNSWKDTDVCGALAQLEAAGKIRVTYAKPPASGECYVEMV
jgi:hypothetical protein